MTLTCDLDFADLPTMNVCVPPPRGAHVCVAYGSSMKWLKIFVVLNFGGLDLGCNL